MTVLYRHVRKPSRLCAPAPTAARASSRTSRFSSHSRPRRASHVGPTRTFRRQLPQPRAPAPTAVRAEPPTLARLAPSGASSRTFRRQLPQLRAPGLAPSPSWRPPHRNAVTAVTPEAESRRGVEVSWSISTRTDHQGHDLAVETGVEQAGRGRSPTPRQPPRAATRQPPRQPHGQPPGSPQAAPRAATRQPPGSPQAAPRQPPGSRQAATRQPPGSPQAAPRQPPGSRQAATRQPPGSHQAAAGRHFVSSGTASRVLHCWQRTPRTRPVAWS